MDERTASWIVRAAAALNNNMEGPLHPREDDDELVEQALGLAASTVEPGLLWWVPGYSKKDQVIFADPWKRCLTCDSWVNGFYGQSGRLIDCGHQEYADVCASWSPVDGCTCAKMGWAHPFRKPQPWDKRVY